MTRTRPLCFKKVADPMTREEVALAMNCTVERIRQIETEALAKARRILERNGYTLDDLVVSRS